MSENFNKLRDYVVSGDAAGVDRLLRDILEYGDLLTSYEMGKALRITYGIRDELTNWCHLLDGYRRRIGFENN